MNKKLWIYTLLLLVFSCYDDPVADLRESGSAEGTLTVEAAHELYREYMSRRPVSRSLDDGGQDGPAESGHDYGALGKRHRLGQRREQLRGRPLPRLPGVLRKIHAQLGIRERVAESRGGAGGQLVAQRRVRDEPDSRGRVRPKAEI